MCVCACVYKCVCTRAHVEVDRVHVIRGIKANVPRRFLFFFATGQASVGCVVPGSLLNLDTPPHNHHLLMCSSEKCNSKKVSVNSLGDRLDKDRWQEDLQNDSWSQHLDDFLILATFWLALPRKFKINKHQDSTQQLNMYNFFLLSCITLSSTYRC